MKNWKILPIPFIKNDKKPIQKNETPVASWNESEIQDLKLKHSLINLSYKVNDLQENIYRLNRAIQKIPSSK